eukprot:9233538-Pyramimonas_sp.AAC.1
MREENNPHAGDAACNHGLNPLPHVTMGSQSTTGLIWQSWTILPLMLQVGDVDILVNSAGLGSKASSLLKGDTAAWKETLDVNVLALCVATREAVANMTAREVRL